MGKPNKAAVLAKTVREKLSNRLGRRLSHGSNRSTRVGIILPSLRPAVAAAYARARCRHYRPRTASVLMFLIIIIMTNNNNWPIIGGPPIFVARHTPRVPPDSGVMYVNIKKMFFYRQSILFVFPSSPTRTENKSLLTLFRVAGDRKRNADRNAITIFSQKNIRDGDDKKKLYFRLWTRPGSSRVSDLFKLIILYYKLQHSK